MGNFDEIKPGGFNFEDERPAKKPPKFGFTVQEVSEEEISRAKVKPKAAPVVAGADPGRWELPTVAVVLMLLPLVYWLQQWSRSLHGETLSTAPAEVRRSEEVPDPGVSDLALMSKIMVKFAFASERRGYRDHMVPLSELEEESDRDKRRKPETRRPPDSASAEEAADIGIGLEDLEQIAWTRTDRLRVAIVAGELEGAKAALTRLETLRAEADPEGDLAAELHWLSLVYEKGPATVPPDAAESLESRHGWFGRLALSFGKQPADPVRWSVAAGAEEFVSTQLVVVLIQIFASLVGLVVGVLLLIKLYRTGFVVRFEPPQRGGSVFLETFAFFLAGFAFLNLMDLMLFGMGVEGTMAAAAITEVLLWALLGSVFWPLARGMPWREWCLAIGWHRGEGIGKEIVAGLVGHLGSQPILWGAIWLGYLVEKWTDSAEPEASMGYGMFEVPGDGSPALFILGMATVVIWAPVVEETIFRGALFRYFSGRMNLLWAAVISGLLFGLIHPYSPAGIIQVGASGVVWGLMRAWRGSLIAPVTAHALHNATVSLMTVSMVGSLGF